MGNIWSQTRFSYEFLTKDVSYIHCSLTTTADPHDRGFESRTTSKYPSECHPPTRPQKADKAVHLRKQWI